MKSIVIYYSRSGNTRFVSQQIANYLNSEIKELIDKKNRQGVWNWILAGRDAIRKSNTEIEDFSFNANDYDKIYIGCPNWAGFIPPALRTFLEKNKLENSKLVLFCTQDSSGAEKVFASLKEIIPKANIINEKFFNKALRNKESVSDEIKGWLDKIK